MDRQTRWVYTLIDGEKTIRTLCKITKLKLPVLVPILRTLLEQQRIELYDRGGKQIGNIPPAYL